MITVFTVSLTLEGEFVFVLSLRYYVCDKSILSDLLIKFQDWVVWIRSCADKTFNFNFVFCGGKATI